MDVYSPRCCGAPVPKVFERRKRISILASMERKTATLLLPAVRDSTGSLYGRYQAVIFLAHDINLPTGDGDLYYSSGAENITSVGVALWIVSDPNLLLSSVFDVLSA